MQKKTLDLSGIFIFLSFLTTIYSYFYDSSFLIYSGLLSWFAFILLFRTIKKKRLLIILLFLSLLALLYCYSMSFDIDMVKIFSVNQYLLVLLIGVGFLRLIATPKDKKINTLPHGKSSFIRTYLGVHLFGSVINLSSLILVADKLYKKAPLSNIQIVMLTRAFSSDAYWSPFFVAFAAASTYAPNLEASIILSNGIFLAICAFIVTWLEVNKKENFNIEKFKGYPISFETLYIPVVLVFLVLGSSYYDSELKIILLIAIYSFLMTVFILPIKRGLRGSVDKLKTHIVQELPNMKMELGLFLIAGMFGVSISFIILGLDLPLPFEKFDWLVASILLAIFIALSFVGIHPIITIAIIGEFMSEVNHTLLAITFLMAWSTTVSTSPFSGLNLAIQARYDIEAKRIFLLNIPYAIKMYFICIGILYFVDEVLGI